MGVKSPSRRDRRAAMRRAMETAPFDPEQADETAAEARLWDRTSGDGLAEGALPWAGIEFAEDE
jgi:hypothetical protein